MSWAFESGNPEMLEHAVSGTGKRVPQVVPIRPLDHIHEGLRSRPGNAIAIRTYEAAGDRLTSPQWQKTHSAASLESSGFYSRAPYFAGPSIRSQHW
jgi:hypothetical protein